MLKKQKKIALILAAAIIFACFYPGTAAAENYVFPNAIWDILPLWNAAKQQGSRDDILKYGQMMLDCLKTSPETNRSWATGQTCTSSLYPYITVG